MRRIHMIEVARQAQREKNREREREQERAYAKTLKEKLSKA